MNARIAAVAPPYTPQVQASLEKWMPPGAAIEPLRLFRTLVRHERLSERMRGLGAAILGHGLVAARVRELLILRTTARCGAEYEWGVHAAAFSASVGLDEATVRATVLRAPSDVACATDDDALIMRVADELHDSSTISDALWSRLAEQFDAEQLLEMIATAGFYHLIAFTVNAVAVEREPWAWRFPSVVSAP